MQAAGESIFWAERQLTGKPEGDLIEVTGAQKIVRGGTTFYTLKTTTFCPAQGVDFTPPGGESANDLLGKPNNKTIPTNIIFFIIPLFVASPIGRLN